MRKRIVIRLAEPHAPYEASWLIADDTQGERPAVIKTGSLAEAAAACEGTRASVLVPASRVFLAAVAMPASNQRRILSAIPYVLEEQLTQDVDELHFCVAKRNAQGKVATAVVAHSQMLQWQQQLQALGVQVDLLTSEVFALPYQADTWTLLLEDQTALLRTGQETGLSADSDNIDVVLQLTWEATGEHKPQRVVVYDARLQSTSEITLPDSEVEIEQHLLHEPAIVVMQQALPAANFSLNLLQGSYSRKEQLGKLWRPWIPVAALAAVLFVVNVSLNLVESIRMENRAAELQQEIERLYLEAFPGARVQTEQGMIESETKNRLSQLRGGGGGAQSDFVTLLGAVGERFKQTPGLVLERVSYRLGKLDVAITIGDLQALDALKQQLVEGKQLAVEIQSASSREGKVEARLQIARGEA